jgi:dipeptide/tripeptide permease
MLTHSVRELIAQTDVAFGLQLCRFVIVVLLLIFNTVKIGTIALVLMLIFIIIIIIIINININWDSNESRDPLLVRILLIVLSSVAVPRP